LNVHVLFAHPVEDSYQAALHRTVVETLTAQGHAVDDCDLYAEGFQPVLSRKERQEYHDTAINQIPVQGYVDRLQAADALVFCFPVWCFGLPAILKGWFDRVLLPGVSFVLESDGRVTPNMQHIQKAAAVTTYGRPRHWAWWMGDPPRKIMTRYVRRLIAPRAPITYLAHYHMNVSSDRTRARFLARVERAMERF